MVETICDIMGQSSIEAFRVVFHGTRARLDKLEEDLDYLEVCEEANCSYQLYDAGQWIETRKKGGVGAYSAST